MARYILAVTIFACIFGLCIPCIAQNKPSDPDKSAYKAGWDEAWAWGNAFAVKTYFEQLYYPHAVALMDAEKQLAGGKSAEEVTKALATLPGVKGAVVLFTGQQEDAQWPDSLVQFDILAGQLFNTERGARAKEYLAPMMHRTLGGKVAPAQVLTGDKYQRLDLLVRYVYDKPVSESPHAVSIICLVLDPKWITAQIPSVMDSLYRENAQLLFCAASPLNKVWEQSLGVTAGKDTLWWTGRKDVTVRNTQFLWPFEDIEISSYVHTLEKK